MNDSADKTELVLTQSENDCYGELLRTLQDTIAALQPMNRLTKAFDEQIKKVVNPVLISLIHLRDDLNKCVDKCSEELKGKELDGVVAKYIKIFTDIPEQIDDILELYDVTPFKSEPGSKYDPLRQLSVVVVPTAEQNLFKIIAESLSHGYERYGTVISKEKVSVYKVEKQEVPEELNINDITQSQ